MWWTRLALIVGAFYGMTGVMLGALGAHALRNKLDARLLESFQVATRYQITHAIFLVVLALAVAQFPSKLMNSAIVLTILGVLCFSGSIYLLVLKGWKFLGPVTPLGGLMLITGWLLLAIAAFRIQG